MSYDTPSMKLQFMHIFNFLIFITIRFFLNVQRQLLLN